MPDHYSPAAEFKKPRKDLLYGVRILDHVVGYRRKLCDPVGYRTLRVDKFIIAVNYPSVLHQNCADLYYPVMHG